MTHRPLDRSYSFCHTLGSCDEKNGRPHSEFGKQILDNHCEHGEGQSPCAESTTSPPDATGNFCDRATLLKCELYADATYLLASIRVGTASAARGEPNVHCKSDAHAEECCTRIVPGRSTRTNHETAEFFLGQRRSERALNRRKP